jgi:hypothetical protein
MAMTAETNEGGERSCGGALTAALCMRKAQECRERAADPSTSSRRAAVLIAMARSCVALAGQLERLEQIEREEQRAPRA